MHRADIALVSCVKSKRAFPAQAKDLYVSTLFSGLRRYAERNSNSWFVLSAEHGLLHPDQVIAPYERTLLTMRKGERLAWAARVTEQLMPILSRDAGNCEVLFLAGDRYREFIEPFMVSRGYKVTVPLKGLPIGEQLQWLQRVNG